MVEKRSTPILIKRVENHEGEVIYEQKQENEAILRPDLAFVMTHMMTGMFDKKLNGYASVTGSTIINKMTRTYAGKSGSTNADSWMIGYSPQLVSAVWTGYDNGQTLELTSDKTYAKNIWINLWKKRSMERQLNHLKPQKVRSGSTSILKMESLLQRIVPFDALLILQSVRNQPNIVQTIYLTKEKNLPMMEKNDLKRTNMFLGLKKYFLGLRSISTIRYRFYQHNKNKLRILHS